MYCEKVVLFLERVRVLIAEDEALIALALSSQLESLGHTVLGVAENGHVAVELAKRLLPDLIVMDIKMPGMDGLSAAAAINQERLTPIIILTGYSDQDSVRRAGELGVYAYLSKPVDLRELIPSIEIAMNRFREAMKLREERIKLKGELLGRKLIEQAKGILMRRLHCSEEDALRKLRKASRDQNVKMAEAAKQIIFAEKINQYF